VINRYFYIDEGGANIQGRGEIGAIWLYYRQGCNWGPEGGRGGCLQEKNGGYISVLKKRGKN